MYHPWGVDQRRVEGIVSGGTACQGGGAELCRLDALTSSVLAKQYPHKIQRGIASLNRGDGLVAVVVKPNGPMLLWCFTR